MSTAADVCGYLEPGGGTRVGLKGARLVDVDALRRSDIASGWSWTLERPPNTHRQREMGLGVGPEGPSPPEEEGAAPGTNLVLQVLQIPLRSVSSSS